MRTKEEIAIAHEEILSLSERELDRRIALAMGCKTMPGELDCDLICGCEETPDHDWPHGGTDYGEPTCEIARYSTDDVLRVIEYFRLTVTPKLDATEKSRWLADFELKAGGQLWLGYGPTIGVASCRAVLLREVYGA